MQAIAPVTEAQLLAPGQESLMKVEIYVGAAWINLNSLAGENYVLTAGISLGGASMTPNPVAGKWNANLHNDNSIFTPQHPTSAYKDYLHTERLVRISVGAIYDDVEYYWQRIQGYMDVPKFSVPEYTVSISGGDYMKRLRDTELRSPNNYWGSSATYNSIASDGIVGAELYLEADAMATIGEANNVANWVATNCTFVSFADVGAGSTWVGKVTATEMEDSHIENTDVINGNATIGTIYKISFWYRWVGGPSNYPMTAGIYQGATKIGSAGGLDSSSYKQVTFYVTAVAAVPLIMRFRFHDVNQEFRIDNISILEFVPYWDRYYELPGPATGPYYVTLDGDPQWQGEGDEEWKYAPDAEAGPDPPAHPAKIVYFNINKEMANGVNNIVISYFEQQVPENIVADLILFAGVSNPTTDLPYVNRAAVLAVMQFDATGKTIDMTWFVAGTKCLNAIKKICEFCDYRFYFRYDGVPFFKPKSAAGAPVFTFTSPSQITSSPSYQAKREIYNRIVIKGLKVSETPGKEETMPSDLTGEAADDGGGGSIELYGERTKTITNHLFQTQAGIDAMVIAMLAESKDPKWYTDLKLDFSPVPLELGDNIRWPERLSPVLDITKNGIVRDIKISNYSMTFKCVLT